ncbi:MAG: hypothetical protein ISS45_07600 [Candidatus Omnitrophica bacterium]|nr:hypothetical protein [Candidatus Omnitrophota bacterium]
MTNEEKKTGLVNKKRNLGLLIQIGGVLIIGLGTYLSKTLGLLIWIVFLVVGLWVIRIGGRVCRKSK